MVKYFVMDISESEDIFSKNVLVEFAPHPAFDGRDHYQLSWEADGSKIGTVVMEENGDYFSVGIHKSLSEQDLTRIYTQIAARENAPKARAEKFPFSIDEFENSQITPFSISVSGQWKSRKAKNSVDKTRQLTNLHRMSDDKR